MRLHQVQIPEKTSRVVINTEESQNIQNKRHTTNTKYFTVLIAFIMKCTYFWLSVKVFCRTYFVSDYHATFNYNIDVITNNKPVIFQQQVEKIEWNYMHESGTMLV